MSISQIAQSISQSATLKLNETVTILRKQGKPVIHLGGGEPKSKAPNSALRAAAEMLETGEIRYTPASGTVAIKEAIIGYTKEFYGITVEPKNIMASGGAKQAIMVCLQAILNPKDELLFLLPYWVSYPEMAKLCGAVPVPVMPAGDSFQPQLQNIEQKTSDRTKAIIINSPNNPTGVMYSKEFIADIVRFCEERGIYLIMDDIYHRLIFENQQPISCYQFAENFGDDSKLVTINGVSKQYAMTGFRIGWSVANKNLIKVMTNIQGHQTSGPSALSQHAAIGALAGDQTSVEELRRTLENNRNVLLEQLASIDGIRVTKPDGTFYCFVDFSGYEKDSTKLAQFLLEKVQVVTVPGIAFGIDGYLRLSFCGSCEDIIEGIQRIKWLLDSDSPKELCIGKQKWSKDWN